MEDYKRFCTNCGKELTEQTAFCPGCGVAVSAPAEQHGDEQVEVSQPTQISDNTVGVIENPQSGKTDYTTVPYSAGYEMSQPEAKKKKASAKVVIPIIFGAILVCAAIGLLGYFTSDAYTYKKAVALYNAEQYEDSFELFYDLGDYKDSKSFLPFHGRYERCSDDPDRFYKFGEDTYEYIVMDEEDGDKTYDGEFYTDGYSTAYLTEEDGEKKTFEVYEQYIYRTDSEDDCFDQTIDFSQTFFNAVLKESISYKSLTMDYVYTFEDDGTFVQDSKAYLDGDKFFEESLSGTYDVSENVITITYNEDSSKYMWLVDDGNVYRSVFTKSN